MKREVIQYKELERVVNGAIQELSVMYDLDDFEIYQIINTYSEMMSDFTSKIIVVNLN